MVKHSRRLTEGVAIGPGLDDDPGMTLVAFPPGEPVLTGRPFDEGIWAEVDGLLAQGLCPSGWLNIETAETRLTCLFHQSRTYLAGLAEPEAFSWVPLHDFPVRANQLEGAACSLVRADPVRVLLLAVHFRNRPVLQATTDLVDLGHVLNALADDGHDAALALERDDRRTLLFLQQGVPARVFFGDPGKDPGRGDVAERFLAYAFDPAASLTRVEVFKQLGIEHDQDEGRPLSELASEAKPPPPMSLLVSLGGRVVMQRPFMPPSMIIGRDHGCELLLDNLSVSRRHVKLAWERGKFVLVDLGSVNGTTVNGNRIERHQLSARDKIGVGKFELTLSEPPDVHDPDQTMLLQPGAEVTPGASGGALYLVGDDQSVPLSGEVTIGKTRGVDVRARGFWVRPVHVRLFSEGPGVHRLTCPGGAGVQLNGAQVTTAYLKAGDELVVGRSRFRVSAGPA